MEIKHTYNKKRYATRLKRKVTFLDRPEQTRQKRYREPYVADVKSFPTVALAEQAMRAWERSIR